MFPVQIKTEPLDYGYEHDKNCFRDAETSDKDDFSAERPAGANTQYDTANNFKGDNSLQNTNSGSGVADPESRSQEQSESGCTTRLIANNGNTENGCSSMTGSLVTALLTGQTVPISNIKKEPFRDAMHYGGPGFSDTAVEEKEPESPYSNLATTASVKEASPAPTQDATESPANMGDRTLSPAPSGGSSVGGSTPSLDTTWQQKRSKLHSLLFGRNQSSGLDPSKTNTASDREPDLAKVKKEHTEELPEPHVISSQPSSPVPVSLIAVVTSYPSTSSSHSSTLSASILQHILSQPKLKPAESCESPSRSPSHCPDLDLESRRYLDDQRVKEERRSIKSGSSSLLQSILTCPINDLGQSTVANVGVKTEPRDSKSLRAVRSEQTRITNNSSEILKMLQKPLAPYSKSLPVTPSSVSHQTPVNGISVSNGTPGAMPVSKYVNNLMSNVVCSVPSPNTSKTVAKATRSGEWTKGDNSVSAIAGILANEFTSETLTQEKHSKGDESLLATTKGDNFVTSGNKGGNSIYSAAGAQSKGENHFMQTWDSMIERAILSEKTPTSTPLLKEFLRDDKNVETSVGVKRPFDARKKNSDTSPVSATVKTSDNSSVRAPKRAKVQHLVDSAIQNALQTPPKYSTSHYPSALSQITPQVSINDGHMFMETAVRYGDSNASVHDKVTSPSPAKSLDSVPSSVGSYVQPGGARLGNADLEIQKMLSQQVQQELEQKSGDRYPLFKCQTCGQRFQHAGTLKVHQRGHNFAEKQFQCDICGKVVTDASYLLIHKRTHRVETAESQAPPNLFECPICKKLFTQYDNYKIHARTHTGEKLFKCEVCQTGFTRSSQLMIHMRIHTGERPFECPVCHVTFRQSGGLKLHMTTHTQNKPHKCELCNESFGRKAHLDKHRRYHTGERPFHCDICNKTFIDAGNLQQHLRKTHSYEKPYVCGVCKQVFKHKMTLKEHLKSHTGERALHRCQFCEKEFLRKASLVKHMSNHAEAKKPFSCSICSESFWTRHRLQKHYKTHAGTHNFCDLLKKGQGQVKIKSKGGRCRYCDLTFNKPGDLKVHILNEHGDEIDDGSLNIYKHGGTATGSHGNDLKSHTSDSDAPLVQTASVLSDAENHDIDSTISLNSQRKSVFGVNYIEGEEEEDDEEEDDEDTSDSSDESEGESRFHIVIERDSTEDEMESAEQRIVGEEESSRQSPDVNGKNDVEIDGFKAPN